MCSNYWKLRWLTLRWFGYGKFEYFGAKLWVRVQTKTQATELKLSRTADKQTTLLAN